MILVQFERFTPLVAIFISLGPKVRQNIMMEGCSGGKQLRIWQPGRWWKITRDKYKLLNILPGPLLPPNPYLPIITTVNPY